MSTFVDDGAMTLSELNVDEIRSVISNAADLAILMTQNKAVLEVFGRPDIIQALGAKSWTSSNLDEVMDPVSARKLGMPPSEGASPVKVTHSTTDGDLIEFVYSHILLGSSGCTLILGRDESRVAALQNRLLEQHRTAGERLEIQKHSEAQYRKLFAIGAEPVLVVDGDSGKILDMNASAAALLDVDPDVKVGRQFSSLLLGADRSRLRALFAAALATKATETATLRLISEDDITIRATNGPGASSTLLVQLSSGKGQGGDPGNSNASVLDLIRMASEAVVIVDSNGVITWANPAFEELGMSMQDNSVAGENLDAFLDARELDLSVVLSNLQRHGEIKQLPATMRTAAGERLEVELSAVAIASADSDEFGFSIRRMPSHPSPVSPTGDDGSVDALWEQLGSAPLRELVNQEIAGIERNLIRAALELNKGNRSATARLLGLSRQSLYSKLDRYGIAPE